MKWWVKIKKMLAFLYGREIDKELLEALLDVITFRFKRKERIKGNVYFFYPAEVSKCLRVTYHKYFNKNIITGANPSSKAGTVMDFGLKELIKEFQRKNKWLFLIDNYPVKFEIKLDNGDKIVISGSVDFVANNAIIEIKSSSSPDLKPKESDILQTGFYAKVLSMEYKKPMKAFLVLVYRKLFFYDIYELSEKEINEGFQEVVNRALLLYKHIKDRKEPEPLPGNWCTGCPLLEKCEVGKRYVEKTFGKSAEYFINYTKKDLKKLDESYKKLFGRSVFDL